MSNNAFQIVIPGQLHDNDIALAKDYAAAQFESNFNIAGFCKKHGISTKTWYAKYKSDSAFMGYVDRIIASHISHDEREAFKKMKQHVLRFAYKDKPTISEMKLFFQTFEYLLKADEIEQRKRFGISEDKTEPEMSIVEKRERLLARLGS